MIDSLSRISLKESLSSGFRCMWRKNLCKFDADFWDHNPFFKFNFSAIDWVEIFSCNIRCLLRLFSILFGAFQPKNAFAQGFLLMMLEILQNFINSQINTSLLRYNRASQWWRWRFQLFHDEFLLLIRTAFLWCFWSTFTHREQYLRVPTRVILVRFNLFLALASLRDKHFFRRSTV